MQRTRQRAFEYHTMAWHADIDEGVRHAWRHLLAVDAQAQIFDYPEWLLPAQAAGCVAPWRAVSVFRQGSPIALLPLRKRSPWTAEVVSYLSPDHAPLLIDPAYGEEACAGIVEWFARESGMRMLAIGPISDPQRISWLEDACRARGLDCRRRALLPSMGVSFFGGWEEFLGQLGPTTRRNVKAAEKRLRRDFPDLSCRILTENSLESEAALEEMMQLHRERWKGQIGGSIFTDARTVTAYRQIVRWALEQGYAALPVLKIAEKVIAVLVIFRLPQQSYALYHLFARDTQILSNYYSPGFFLFFQAFHWDIARGTTMAWLGAGRSEYKSFLGGKETPVWEVTITRNARAHVVMPLLDRGLHIARRLPVHLQYHLHRAVSARGGENGKTARRTIA